MIGAILSGSDGCRGFIYHTAVRENERHKGARHLLADSAMSAPAAKGIIKVAPLVCVSNRQGSVFWKKYGFTPRTDLVYRNKVIREQKPIAT